MYIIRKTKKNNNKKHHRLFSANTMLSIAFLVFLNLILLNAQFITEMPIVNDIIDKNLKEDKQESSEDMPPLDIEENLTPIGRVDLIPQPQNYHKANISQYDIEESLRWRDKQNNINITSQNATMAILNQESFISNYMNITEIWRPFNVEQNGQINAPANEWFADRNPTTVLSPLTDFHWQMDNTAGNLNIQTAPVIPAGLIVREGYFAQWAEVINRPKPSYQITTSDFIQSGDEYFGTGGLFDNTDPQYIKLTNNPYGGVTQGAKLTLEWVPGVLRAGIKAGLSSQQLGRPSIAWKTPDFQFSQPYDKVVLYISWNMDNRGYEATDNVSVIARVDGNYVDGTKDSLGNPYNNPTEPIGTTTTLENDVLPEHIHDHGFVNRHYDVTALLNKNISAYHNVDFGVKMANTSDTDDEFMVEFDYAVLMFYTNDIYKIGEIEFDFQIDQMGTTNFLSNFFLFSMFVPTTGTMGSKAHIYGNLQEIMNANGGSGKYVPDVRVNLTSDFLPFVNVDSFYFTFGVYCYITTSQNDNFGVLVDNIELKLNYKETILPDVGLQVLNENDEWEDIMAYGSQIFTTPTNSTHISLDFRAQNSPWTSSAFMKFNSYIDIKRTKQNSAAVSFGFNSWNPALINWNITYNNTASIWDIFTTWGDDSKYEFMGYNITYVDLPAFDNLGGSSTDWKFIAALGPQEYNFNAFAYRTNGKYNSPARQNLTLINPLVEINEELLHGNFTLYYDSPNYLQSAIVYADPKSPKEIFYDMEGLLFEVNLTSSQAGQYNISILDPTLNNVALFPKIYPGINGNLTTGNTWTVDDSTGLGLYRLEALWYNTSLEGRIERIGAKLDTFRIHEKTHGSIIQHATPDIVAVGQKSNVKIQYNGTDPEIGISGATIQIFNGTKLWGTEWAPYIYKPPVNVVYLGDGNYSFDVNTDNIPKGNYTLRIVISKQNYDPLILFTALEIGGDPLIADLIAGVVQVSNQYYLEAWNIPYVNDITRGVITINVTDIMGQPLRYVSIAGRLNQTGAITYGVELYTLTFNEEDKGIYNITIDTTGWNSTEYAEYNNVSFSISISLAGYAPASKNISCSINRSPSQIDAIIIPSTYEGGELEVYCQFMNILNPSTPLPIEGGGNTLVTWGLNNGSGSIATGFFEYVAPNSGVYLAYIELSGAGFSEQYIYPGIYTFIINGEAWNQQDDTWSQISLTILAKTATNLEISTNTPIRIGSELYIEAVLTQKHTGMPVPSVAVNLKIIYATISFDIVGTTDSLGKISYSQIVPYEFDDTDLTIEGSYAGNSTYHQAFKTIIRHIYGKIPVNLTWINLPLASAIRVGYTVTLNGQLSIEGVSDYNDRYVTLTILYGGSMAPQFKNGRCDSEGNLAYTLTLEDGYNNVTFLIEFAGTATEAYAINSTFYNIFPKWGINLLFIGIDASTRIGYEVPIQVIASFADPLSPESLFGLEVKITFTYNGGATQVQFSRFLDVNGLITFSYTIPQDCGPNLIVNIDLQGTTKIASANLNQNYPIQPKWNLNIDFVDFPSTMVEGLEFLMIVQASFPQSNPTGSLFGLNISVKFQYSGSYTTITGTLDEVGRFSFDYQVLKNTGTTLMIEITIEETQTVAAKTYSSSSLTILPQKETVLTLISSEIQQSFGGEFLLSAKLTDSDGTPIEGHVLVFIIKDEDGKVIGTYNTTTNAEGIGSVRVELLEIGSYSVEVYYPSQGIYATISNKDSTIRVINYGILLLDNWDIILIIIAVITAIGIAINKTIVAPRKMRYFEALKSIHQRFEDAENIQYILITHQITGLSLFSRAFTEMPIDETLVSGFLSAITSFGAEISQKVKESGQNAAQGIEQGGLEELSYQQFKIAVFDSQYVRTALLLLKPASKKLREKARIFNNEFERKFETEVKNFKGKAMNQNPILELIELTFNADLLYPHKMIPKKTVNIPKSAKTEQTIIKEAKKPEFNNTFKVREMINQMTGYGIRDVDTFNAIERLRAGGIVFAVNPRTQYLIEQFQPIIEKIDVDERQVLIAIVNGEQTETGLHKAFKKLDVGKIIQQLKNQQLIDDQIMPSNLGEIVATILQVVPDL